MKGCIGSCTVTCVYVAQEVLYHGLVQFYERKRDTGRQINKNRQIKTGKRREHQFASARLHKKTEIRFLLLDGVVPDVSIFFPIPLSDVFYLKVIAG